MQEDSLFFGFAPGDRIILDVEEENGRDLKSLSVVELPTVMRYLGSKSSEYHQNIDVSSKSVYQFVFRNGAMSARNCKVRIQRVPRAEWKNFRTGWKWATVYDTTYTYCSEDSLVGYDTASNRRDTRMLISSEFKEINLLDKSVHIKSKGIIKHDNPHMVVPIKMPQLEHSVGCEQEVVAWAYWMGVGPSAETIFSKNKGKIISLSGLVSSNPLVKLAVGLVADLIIPDGNRIDPVTYAITNEGNRKAFMEDKNYKSFDQGFGKGAYKRFSEPEMCQGTYYLCLKNENLHRSVDVTVKAVAVVKEEHFKDREHEKTKTTPRYISIDKKRMVVTPRQIRVNVE